MAAKQQELHKFDVPQDLSLSVRQRIREQYGERIGFIGTLQDGTEETPLVQPLNLYAASEGRRVGEVQARGLPDRTFATFVNQYRPPRY